MRTTSSRRLLLLLPLMLLAGGVALLGGVSFWHKVQSFQPIGLEVEGHQERWVVSAVEDDRLPLERGDQLLLVNGALIKSRSELQRELTRHESSDLIVMRDDQVRTVRYERPPLEIDFPYLVLALTGVIYLLIGFYTMTRELSRQVFLFFLWCLGSAALYIFYARLPPVDTFDQVVFLADEIVRLFLPALTLHFFLIFPRRLSGAPWLNRALPFLYLPPTALLTLQLDLAIFQGRFVAGVPSEAKLRLLDHLGLYQLALCAIASVLLLISHLWHTRDWEEGRQTLWVTLGMAGGYIPFLFLYLLPTFLGLRTPDLIAVVAVVPLSLVPLSFAYAILRYRLWDIAVIVRDVTTYTLTLLLGVFGFSLLNLVINRGIPEDFTVVRNLMTLLAGLLMAGLLIPTKQGISSTLQRFHYRSTFSRRRALSQFGHDLLHERDLEQLSSSLLQELDEALDLEQSNLFLVEDSQLRAVREDDSPQDLSVESFSAELWRGDVEKLTFAGFPEDDDASSQALLFLGYRYLFPLTVRDRRVGLFVAGYKQGGIPLSSDDIVLIRQLLNQVALAVENAQLLETLHRQLTEVQELRQFNEEIIESSPAGIAVFDGDERVISANLAFAAIAGVERSSARRRRLRELLPLERVPQTEEGLMEVSFKDHQGRERHLQLSAASFLRSTADRLYVLVAHDVTERRRMERTLEEKERLAALGVMAAGVAHEVNTPLTGISSYAQMLLVQTPESDPRHETLKKVERQTFRAARIVNSLLEFARSREPKAEPVSVGAVIGECLDLLAERLEAHGVSLRWTEPEAAAFVEANEDELHQVFNNVLVNAIDAMAEEGGCLTVRLEVEGESAAVFIEDTGPGIAPDKLSLVFQPFFSTKLQTGGTGLGLSISYEMVRRHGGDIRVANLPDGGCQFVVRFPLSSPRLSEVSL